MHLDPRTLCSACVNVSVGGAGVCVYACACVRVCARRCVHGCSHERVFCLWRAWRVWVHDGGLAARGVLVVWDMVGGRVA